MLVENMDRSESLAVVVVARDAYPSSSRGAISTNLTWPQWAPVVFLLDGFDEH